MALVTHRAEPSELDDAIVTDAHEPPSPAWLAAIHESGHSVLGLLLGVSTNARAAVDGRGGGVVIQSESEIPVDRGAALAEGMTRAALIERGIYPPLPRRQPFEHLLTLLAGQAAEEILLGRPVQAWHDVAVADTWIAAWRGLPRFSQRVLDARAQLEAIAMALVRKNWPWILRVAAALLEQGSLDAEHIQSLRHDKQGDW